MLKYFHYSPQCSKIITVCFWPVSRRVKCAVLMLVALDFWEAKLSFASMVACGPENLMCSSVKRETYAWGSGNTPRKRAHISVSTMYIVTAVHLFQIASISYG